MVRESRFENKKQLLPPSSESPKQGYPSLAMQAQLEILEGPVKLKRGHEESVPLLNRQTISLNKRYNSWQRRATVRNDTRRSERDVVVSHH